MGDRNKLQRSEPSLIRSLSSGRKEMTMLILEEKTESPTLNQLIRKWWAKLWAWLRRQSRRETQTYKQDRDSPKSLIL